MHCIYSFYTDVVWMFFYESVSRAVLQLIVVSCRLPLYSCCGAGVQDSCGAQLKCCAHECRMEFAGFGKKKIEWVSKKVALSDSQNYCQLGHFLPEPLNSMSGKTLDALFIYALSLPFFFFFKTPSSWAEETRGRRSAGGHKRSASWGSAEHLREASIVYTKAVN